MKKFITGLFLMALLFGCADDRLTDQQIEAEADRLSAAKEIEYCEKWIIDTNGIKIGGTCICGGKYDFTSTKTGRRYVGKCLMPRTDY